MGKRETWNLSSERRWLKRRPNSLPTAPASCQTSFGNFWKIKNFHIVHECQQVSFAKVFKYKLPYELFLGMLLKNIKNFTITCGCWSFLKKKKWHPVEKKKTNLWMRHLLYGLVCLIYEEIAVLLLRFL